MAVLLVPAAPVEAKRLGARVLEEGDKGKDVKRLQRLLTRAGFETTIDGEFGPATETVLMGWEELNDRRVDGRVTRRDARALRRAARRGPEEPIANDVVDPDADDRAEPTAGGASFVDIRPASINDDGSASPPTDAPKAVAAIIEAGNEIHDKPYKWGGGHGRWKDSGYDCSGSMSYALHGAGLLDTSMNSTGFESYGEPGPGQWVTIYANASHAYMVVAGMRFDTSAAKANANGSRWSDDMRSPSGYVVRHPPGL